MIKQLYIQNFVLIDELSLQFENGFSVFLGETGAGKSILIDAISLLCADRANSSVVRKGSSKAIVEGTFDLSNNPHALRVLEESGFDYENDITFTREIQMEGKSVVRMDHRIITLGLMKDILRDEIDIHGQRDTQYLLNKNTHIQLLDRYANCTELLQKVKQLYDVYHSLCEEKELALSQTYNENDLEFITYQLKEIQDADLKEGEEEELVEKEKSFHAMKNSYDSLHKMIETYQQMDETFYDLNHSVQNLEDSELFSSIKTRINDAYYEVNDAMGQLQNIFSSFEMSEEDINAMEERLFTIQRMKRKYGSTIPAILARKEELERQIEMIENRSSYLKEIDAKIDKAFESYSVEAKKLHDKRVKYASKLDSEVATKLKDLSLPNAKFYTQIKEKKASLNGVDDVEFLICMNKGEDLKPLNTTASGGELSRLMLGLKTIFTALQGTQIIIFDEIDAGVSGKVASAIGKKMQELGKGTQIFSVTHLAPVAAHCSNAYLVSKKVVNNTTKTIVKQLNEAETIEQLALISSGQVTSASLDAAEELYRSSQG